MPDDTTPHGGEALHPPPDRATIPQAQEGPAAGSQEPADPRPPLPTEALVRAEDLEEEAPGPGTAGDAGGTGKPSVTRQPG